MAKYADITPFYELIDSVMKEDTLPNPEHNTLMFYEIIDELDSLPEVVRCKDCKHREESQWCDGYQCGNPYYGMASGVELKDDDFCSYGERRTDNGE